MTKGIFCLEGKVRGVAATMIMALALFGCVKATAIIADLESDKVVVQSGPGTEDHEIVAKAFEGCALHDRVPVPLSTQCMNEYCSMQNNLFACVDP